MNCLQEASDRASGSGRRQWPTDRPTDPTNQLCRHPLPALACSIMLTQSAAQKKKKVTRPHRPAMHGGRRGGRWSGGRLCSSWPAARMPRSHSNDGLGSLTAHSSLQRCASPHLLTQQELLSMRRRCREDTRGHKQAVQRPSNPEGAICRAAAPIREGHVTSHGCRTAAAAGQLQDSEEQLRPKPIQPRGAYRKCRRSCAEASGHSHVTNATPDRVVPCSSSIMPAIAYTEGEEMGRGRSPAALPPSMCRSACAPTWHPPPLTQHPPAPRRQRPAPCHRRGWWWLPLRSDRRVTDR